MGSMISQKGFLVTILCAVKRSNFFTSSVLHAMFMITSIILILALERSATNLHTQPVLNQPVEALPDPDLLIECIELLFNPELSSYNLFIVFINLCISCVHACMLDAFCDLALNVKHRTKEHKCSTLFCCRMWELHLLQSGPI